MPLADPGRPDLRSPARFLLWIAKGQWGLLAVGMICGVLWMPAQALIPAALGKAIDEGVSAGDQTAGSACYRPRPARLGTTWR
jgi:hypothetical protein